MYTFHICLYLCLCAISSLLRCAAGAVGSAISLVSVVGATSAASSGTRQSPVQHRTSMPADVSTARADGGFVLRTARTRTICLLIARQRHPYARRTAGLVAGARE
ncbi:hypothetical protein BC567DRAFT_232750 [Phyllosticta citribraziliensis]